MIVVYVCGNGWDIAEVGVIRSVKCDKNGGVVDIVYEERTR